MDESLKSLKLYIQSEKEYLNILINRSYKERYHTFYLRRKNGKKRIITAPNNSLKNVQQKIANNLHKIYSSHNCVHGYLYERNIITNALPHINKYFVINIDLKNFFESIKRDRIVNLFASKPFEFIGDELNILCDICIFDDHLPLGAPTSPILSNFVCESLDESVSSFCAVYKIDYTRYADDLTFSSNIDLSDTNLTKYIFSIIESNGFIVNQDKFRVRTKSMRQEVTGLTVNSKLNVRKSYIKNIRAILYNWEQFGIIKTSRKYRSKYYRSKLNGTPNFLDSIRGKIEFIGMVRGKQDSYYLRLMNKYLSLCQYNSEPDDLDETEPDDLYVI
jgi:RNA-directed DNA polymerase